MEESDSPKLEPITITSPRDKPLYNLIPNSGA
jgi:hypothetical protein